MKHVDYQLIVWLVLAGGVCSMIYRILEHFESNPEIKYYLINLGSRIEKRHNFEHYFGTGYIHIEAVDGNTLQEPWSCLDGRPGYKGLQMSNVKVFEDAIRNDYEYIVIFEDDAEPPPEFHNIVLDALATFPDSKVIYS